MKTTRLFSVTLLVVLNVSFTLYGQQVLSPIAQADGVVPQKLQPASTKRHLICATCGCLLEDQVVRYCRSHNQRFGSALYCRQHQKAF